jgi:hypothetical protein
MGWSVSGFALGMAWWVKGVDGVLYDMLVVKTLDASLSMQ